MLGLIEPGDIGQHGDLVFERYFLGFDWLA